MWNRSAGARPRRFTTPGAGWGATAFEFGKSMGDALSADEQNVVDSNDD